MKKCMLCLISLILASAAYAVDFKVGEAKYEVTSGNSVMLKEYKKATGDVVLPEKVKDSKGGAEYTLTSIGKEAFKNSAITSVTVPGSVSAIGEKSFMDCAALKSVKLLAPISIIPKECFENTPSLNTFEADFNKLLTVGDKAFKGSAISVEPLYIAVKGTTTYNHYGLVTNEMKKKGFKPLIVLSPSSNVEVAANLIKAQHDPVLVFTDRLAGQYAFDILYKVFDPDYMVQVSNYKPEPDLLGVKPDKYGKNSLLRKRVSKINELRRQNRWSPLEEPKFSAYFGAEETAAGLELLDDTRYDAVSALEIIGVNTQAAPFRSKLQEFVSTAVAIPADLPNRYRDISPEEAMEYNDEVTNVVRVLLDSVYLVKPELTEAEITNVSGFINNLLMGIGADYGRKNMQLGAWASYDILNKDLASGYHKEDYERILMSADRFLKYPNVKEEDVPYTMAVQLAALCGTERWKEAASYFPKVHRAVTANGKYIVPSELDYMQKAINAHGYKAVAPTYQANKPKGGSKSSKASQASSDSNGSLIEFFTDKAIKAGIERYQRKKAEKEFRQLYYESLGLDKKGRPKKRRR